MGMKSLEQFHIDIIDVVKRQLGQAIRDKGGTVNDTDAWSAFVSAVANMTNKRWASGTTTSSSSQSQFRYADGSTTYGMYYVNVTGLTFKPSYIIITTTSTPGERMSIYSEIYDGHYSKTVKAFSFGGASGQGTIANFRADVSPASVTSTGFLLPVWTANTSYTWIAFE
jgi:hypothetical protein